MYKKLFNSKKTITIVLGISFLIICSMNTNANRIMINSLIGENTLINEISERKDETREIIPVRTPKKAGYWPENFLHVNNNWTLTNNTYNWCSGKGTQEDPYIINDVIIDAGGTNIGILIENTREWFEIRNCTIKNSEIGIKVLNATNFRIINTTIYNINGLDGINGVSNSGQDGTNGTNGTEAIGILLSNCTDCIILLSNITGISGGNGGFGGNGATGGDISLPGYNGGSGGIGGNAYGIFVNNSFKISIEKNNISYLTGGIGGKGGRGGNGNSPLYFDDGGDGGDGRQGGYGGIVEGISLLDDVNISIYNNRIYNNTSGNGGDGGDGGSGGNGGDTFSSSFPVGDGGDGGNGGAGGEGGFFIGINFKNVKNFTNILNSIEEGSIGIGGRGGLGGIGGAGGSPGGYPGTNGIAGSCGENYTAYGFSLHKSNYSLNYFNTIFCQNNYDNGINNKWDDGNIGNFWSYHIGNDFDPLDGIIDNPYYLLGSAGSLDNRPLICSPLKDIDIDGDGLDNAEEYTLGVDGYKTNPSNHDSDYDGLSDYWEWKNGTNPLMKDTDSDSFLDGVEVIMGTDPNDPASYPGCELFVDIIDEFFTKAEFKISFFIHDWKNQGIIGANFIIWWNETIVPPGNVNPIGVGYYDITLTP
ncbi:MAG: hypothetical protein ACFFBP_22630, partial [Promethearchaeota archaeon]